MEHYEAWKNARTELCHAANCPIVNFYEAINYFWRITPEQDGTGRAAGYHKIEMAHSVEELKAEKGCDYLVLTIYRGPVFSIVCCLNEEYGFPSEEDTYKYFLLKNSNRKRYIKK